MTDKGNYQFDLIDAAGFGYSTVWAERFYLLKMALVPLILKFASMVVITAQGFGDNALAQGLILIPATLAEGWLMAQFLRTLIKQERWPVILEAEPDAPMLAYLMTRARGIIACCLIYVLMMLVTYVFKFGYDQMIAQNIIPAPDKAGMNGQSSDPRMMVIAVIGLIFSLWSFRFFWLYIPFSVLVGPQDYLKYLGGFMSSVRMLGLFLISSVPCLVITMVLSAILVAPFQGTGDEVSKIGNFIIMLIGSAAEILIALTATAAIAWSMRGLLPRAKGALPDVNNNKDA